MMRESAAPDQSDFEDLTRRLRGVHDVALRVGAARLSLTDLGPAQLSAVVQCALDAVRDGRPDGQDALAALGLALEASDWDALRGRAALHALGEGRPLVATYLVPKEEPPPEGAPLSVPDFGVGRPLTLGERKSVARGRNPDVVARVLRDPDPAVIRILLGNPSLVEAQVVRLAARRPVQPAVLREVYRSLRWSARHAVRLALVQNPWCPVDVGVRIAPLLTLAERRSVATGAEIPLAVRTLCDGLATR